MINATRYLSTSIETKYFYPSNDRDIRSKESRLYNFVNRAMDSIMLSTQNNESIKSYVLIGE